MLRIVSLEVTFQREAPDLPKLRVRLERARRRNKKKEVLRISKYLKRRHIVRLEQGTPAVNRKIFIPTDIPVLAGYANDVIRERIADALRKAKARETRFYVVAEFERPDGSRFFKTVSKRQEIPLSVRGL